MIEIGRDKCLGYEVIVGGDFNESLERGKLMEERMKSGGLVNLVKSRVNPMPLTRIGSTQAIDHIWCSRGLQNKVERVGLVLRDQAFLSDHLGLFTDVQIEKNKVEQVERG